MKKFIFVLFLSILVEGIHPSFVVAASTTNSGFIQGNIWYSQESLQNGDKVTIYTAVWNGGDTSLSVKVDFYDNETYLNSEMGTVLPQSLEKISIPWKVTAGDHTIIAKIASSTTTSKDGKKPIVIARNTTTGNKIFVSTNSPPPSVNTENSNVVKDEVRKVSQALENSKLPAIVAPISEGFGSVDQVRTNLYNDIVKSKTDTQLELKKSEPATSATTKKAPTTDKKLSAKPLDATHTPILYVKLFFLQIVGFILGNKYVFYGSIAIILWILGKLLYQKVRNK